MWDKSYKKSYAVAGGKELCKLFLKAKSPFTVYCRALFENMCIHGEV